MSVKSFTVGGVQYNAAMASAYDQDRLLSMLSASLIERAFTAARSGIELSNDIVMTMFMAMPQQVKSQAAEILMARVVINGTDRTVTVADFGGKMVQYNQLLSDLLRWNLSDFFDWLPSAQSAEKAAAQTV